MFFISDISINEHELKNKIKNPSAGGFVCFEGWVRNLNEGKEVLKLEYEAYESLAKKEAEKIIAEAKEKFDILDILAVHRVGLLELEDIAVWIGVNAKHRKAAFKACEYLIDNIKIRLPIWKKEYYLDGDSGWVNCEACSNHNHSH
ncbi:MAG: molybdenum cofactor biosynthesis protein MoaE [Candidatus Sericytochromatia bacterium]